MPMQRLRRWFRANRSGKGLADGQVIFTAPDKDIERIDIAVGPCVGRVGPRGGHLRPLVSPLDQRRDRVGHLEALFGIIEPEPRGDLWTRCQSDPPGRLCRFSPKLLSPHSPEIWMSPDHSEGDGGSRLATIEEVKSRLVVRGGVAQRTTGRRAHDSLDRRRVEGVSRPRPRSGSVLLVRPFDAGVCAGVGQDRPGLRGVPTLEAPPVRPQGDPERVSNRSDWAYGLD